MKLFRSDKLSFRIPAIILLLGVLGFTIRMVFLGSDIAGYGPEINWLLNLSVVINIAVLFILILPLFLGTDQKPEYLIN
jgi:hypothetical protein